MERELKWISRSVKCQEGGKVPNAVRLQPDLKARSEVIRWSRDLERTGANDGAVPAETKAIVISQPGHFVPGGMKGPEA